MAIINSITIGKGKGSLGNVTLRYVGGDTIGSQKVLKKGSGGTLKQVSIRARWGNIVNLFQAFEGALDKCFEEVKRPRQSDFNLFLSRNIKKSSVYLTADQVRQGGAVVFGAQISEGSLPAISHGQGTGDVILSDIAVGSMSISASTTLRAFTSAILGNNVGWQVGDQLSIFRLTQTVNSETQVPYVTVEKFEVTLNNSAEADDEIIRDYFPSDVLIVDNGKLALGQTVNGGACFVHSRLENGVTLVSTQTIYATNSILPNFISAAQMLVAVESYHGTRDEAFITPNIGDIVAPVTP